jgi:hypothetical protein
MKTNALSILVILVLSSSLNAQTPEIFAEDARIEIFDTALFDATNFTIQVLAPNGQIWEQTITGQHLAEIDLEQAFGRQFPDGQYNYEIRPQASQAQPAAPDELRGLETHSIEVPKTVFGTFAVRGGQLVNPNKVEPQQSSAEVKSPITSTQGADEPGIDDQVIPDDLIVQGSLCVGFDCINNETFSFDTVKLKENNTRLTFIDTSSVSGFPAGDWQIRANDSASGGADFLSIDWLGTTANTGTVVSTPFRVDGGAPNNSLRVTSAGRVGIRTANPVLDLHVATGNTPGIRLEQTNQSGFSAQTWDFAGNEANFFVRDVTGGSRLPFRIRPGAPTSSIDIAASGRVGLGTASPESSLHLRRSDGNTSMRITEASGTTADRGMLRLENNGGMRIDMVNTSSGNDWRFATEHASDSFIVTKIGSGQVEMRIDANGNLTIPGTLFQGSDFRSKLDIVPVNPADILDRLARLPIAFWRYRNDDRSARHIGPMAQDFAELFGVGADATRISTLDTSGVALAAIQELTHRLAAKHSTVEQLKQDNQKIQTENAELHERMARLERAIESLTTPSRSE